MLKKRGLRLAALSAAILLLSLVIPVASANADDDTIRMATVEWAPFYGSDMERNGFVTALVKAAFERAGYEAGIEFIPWARAMHDVELGYRDVLMGAYYTDERAETYIASDDIYSVTVGLVAHPDAGIRKYESLRDLQGYEIGIGRGWAHSPEFDEADYLDKIPEDDQVLNVRKLYADRIDMIAMSFAVFSQIAQEEGVDPEWPVLVEPPLSENSLHLMVSRNLDNGEEIVRDFNRALAEMREDGTYERILRELGIVRGAAGDAE